MLTGRSRQSATSRHLAASLALLAVFAWAQIASAASTPLVGLSLEEAAAVLEQDGLRIFYSTDLVKPTMRVRKEPVSTNLAGALGEILAPFGLRTQAGPNGSVLIVPDPAQQQLAADALAAIRNSDATDPMPPAPTRPPIEEIIVAASRYELNQTHGTSTAAFNGTDIEYLPDLGEDALRAVARLPGFASNGVSARSNIRGGEVSETLVRFDGLRLYEPFHLKDFQSIFSAVDPRVINTMNVYTGGFPAVFGDRMSGVIDVDSISAPENLYHEVGVSLFNTSVLSSGRFAEGRAEWVASIRRSNLDLLYDAFSRQPERPRYSDVFLKLGFEINDRLKLTGNVIQSRDNISLSDDIDREERAQAKHSDSYYWLGLEHSLANELTGRTVLASSQLDNTRRGITAKHGISTGSMRDIRAFSIETIQSDWTKIVNDDFMMQFGGNFSSVQGHYDYSDSVVFDMLFDFEGAEQETARNRMISANPKGKQYSLYGAMRFSLTDKLAADLGLRWDKQTLEPTSHGELGPRIGIRYEISERTQLRASLGRFYQSQGINELEIADGDARFYRPQRSDHFVVGVQHYFLNGNGLRIEAYRKNMTALRPRYENLLNSLILLPELKPDRVRIAPDDARATGVEIMYDGEAGDKINWRVAYSWARVRDRFGQIKGSTELGPNPCRCRAIQLGHRKVERWRGARLPLRLADDDGSTRRQRAHPAGISGRSQQQDTRLLRLDGFSRDTKARISA